MHKKVIVLFLLMFSSITIEAQCAMCRAQLESMDDNTVAEGINNGIVYLMLIPYVLIGVLAYFIYRTFKKKKSK